MDQRSREIWIEAFRDAFCNLSVAAGQLITADLFNDKNFRLIALHSHQTKAAALTRTKSLRIFNGTEMEKEILIKSASTVCADVGQGLLAVAGGSCVYFFKGKAQRLCPF